LLLGKNASIFTEIEAEDETGFAPEVGSTSLSWRISDAANVQMNWSQANWADGYGLLGDHFRLTRGHVALIDKGFGGVDGGKGLRGTRQNVALTGRVAESKLFYNVAIGGIAGDPEGVKDTSTNARVAYDVKKNIMVGAYLLNGEATDLAFSRTGIDTQVDYKNTRIQAAYVMASDDVALGGSEDNNAYSVQAYYTMKTKKGKPTWVPLVRLDHYTKTDGDDSYDELTLNLTHYLAENVKAYIEYWDRFDAPTGEDDNRLTLQFYVGL
jgi:hypothetical protein